MVGIEIAIEEDQPARDSGRRSSSHHETFMLEHFPAEVVPGSAKKVRQNKDLEPRSDSLGSECALGCAAQSGHRSTCARRLKTRPPPGRVFQVRRLPLNFSHAPSRPYQFVMSPEPVLQTSLHQATPPTTGPSSCRLQGRLYQAHVAPEIGSYPLINAGSHIAICGKKHNSTTAMNIKITNGSVPQIISESGISGAMFLMTKMFKPTGG